MNHHEQDNQISAWFDDELTAAERANAKRRLEQSFDARDELTEIGKISDWLGELPHESLPGDFAVGRQSPCPDEEEGKRKRAIGWRGVSEASPRAIASIHSPKYALLTVVVGVDGCWLIVALSAHRRKALRPATRRYSAGCCDPQFDRGLE